MVKLKAIKSKRIAPRGAIIWQDETRVCIMVFGSGNRKTGNMVQTYLLLKNVDPRRAIKNGKDEAICGQCIHRGRWVRENGKLVWRRSCYVNIGQGVLRVWKSYRKGNYPIYSEAIHGKKITNRMLRIGTYGDPAFVPYEVWESILPLVKGHTGYTHQWRTCDRRFGAILMASADQPRDVEFAIDCGYRSFVVVAHDAVVPKNNDMNAIMCVNKSHETKCEDCKLCNGTNGNSTKNIYIPAHGPSKRFLMNLN